MSLAEDLHSVLSGAAAALPEDTAAMAGQAAGVLAGHLAAGAVEVAEDAAVRLIDHLFRGSAAAGAIQSMPPVAEPPAAEAEAAPPDPTSPDGPSPSVPESVPPADPGAGAEPPAAAEAVSAVPGEAEAPPTVPAADPAGSAPPLEEPWSAPPAG